MIEEILISWNWKENEEGMGVERRKVGAPLADPESGKRKRGRYIFWSGGPGKGVMPRIFNCLEFEGKGEWNGWLKIINKKVLGFFMRE